MADRCMFYLNVLICRLAAIRNLVTGKQLMIVLLKLFGFCLKVKANRQELIKLEMNSISIMLGALNLVSLHIISETYCCKHCD
jgi:E3 ubiquitin-protein ligase UBR4